MFTAHWVVLVRALAGTLEIAHCSESESESQSGPNVCTDLGDWSDSEWAKCLLPELEQLLSVSAEAQTPRKVCKSLEGETLDATTPCHNSTV